MSRSTPISIALLVLITFSLASQVFAQKGADSDGPVGIFESRSDYYDFMGSAKQAAYGPDGNAELQAMIPMLNDIALNQPIGSTASQYSTERSTLELLSDEKIRADVEMVDSQYEDLKRLNDEIQKRMAEQIRGLDFGDPNSLVEQINQMRSRSKEEIQSVLLPHQIARLKQIGMQAQLRRRSLAEILTSDPLKTELEIDDAQGEALRESEKEIEAELRREIAKLQEKARNKLIGKLKPKQEAQVKELIGDAFEFAETENPDNRKKRNRSAKNADAKKGKGKWKK